MTAPTPDTSPGDELSELDEILQKVVREFNRSLSDYRDGVRPKPMRQYMAEAKDRLNRLMLTRLQSEHHLARSVSQDPKLIEWSNRRLAAIDAQLNKEETDGDVPTHSEASKP